MSRKPWSNKKFYFVVLAVIVIYLILRIFKRYYPVFFLDATVVFVFFMICALFSFFYRFWLGQKKYEEMRSQGGVLDKKVGGIKFDRSIKNYYFQRRPVERGFVFLIILIMGLIMGVNILGDSLPIFSRKGKEAPVVGGQILQIGGSGHNWFSDYLRVRDIMKRQTNVKLCPRGEFLANTVCRCDFGEERYPLTPKYENGKIVGTQECK